MPDQSQSIFERAGRPFESIYVTFEDDATPEAVVPRSTSTPLGVDPPDLPGLGVDIRDSGA